MDTRLRACNGCISLSNFTVVIHANYDVDFDNIDVYSSYTWDAMNSKPLLLN